MTQINDVENVITFFKAIVRERGNLAEGKYPDGLNSSKYISGPLGFGIFFTGEDGWSALKALVDSCLRTGRIYNRADQKKVRILLSNILIRKFYEEKLEVDKRNVARALSETSKAARREFKTKTHFIPCHLSTDAEKVGLSIGSVRFVSRFEAKRILANALKVEKSVSPDHPKRDRRHLLQAINHYKGFRWYVQVIVEDCGDRRSEEIALTTATSALDFLQLLIGVHHSGRMSIQGRASHYECTASITRDEATGRLNVSTTRRALGQITLPDNWTEQILGGDGQMGLDQAGVVLEARLNPDLERPLSHRMLDAVQWFGEATRDTSPSTRVIKYVTALERLTLTRRVTDIAENVSDRVAALSTGFVENRSFEENKKIFKKIYALRSELVHGSVSPNDSKVIKIMELAGEYAENAIVRALYSWSPMRFRESGMDLSGLDRFFDEAMAWAKAVHR